jgi:chloramphenicol 3-O phosphotransferase
MVIFLNGASSSGKTTIARLLQVLLPVPCLHAGVDSFFGMLPPGLVAFDPARETAARSGMAFIAASAATPGKDAGNSDAAALRQADKWRVDMRRSIAFMAGLGNHLIVDEIITDPRWVAEYRQLLGGIPALWVGVRCPLAILEAREKARTGIAAGHARQHFEAVHAHCRYDLEVDSSALSPYECARSIVARVAEIQPPASASTKKNPGP